MNTKDILDRLLHFIRELSQLYGELSQELPNLRIVSDNTQEYSEVKKRLRENTLFSEGATKWQCKIERIKNNFRLTGQGGRK